MKKIIIAVALLTATLTACTGDFLDRTPSDHLTTGGDGPITSLMGVKTATEGLYALMASSYYYNANMFLYGDVKGDDLVVTSWSSGRTLYPYCRFQHTTDMPNAGGLWGRPYFIIRNAWNLIDAIDGGKVADATAEELAPYKGQALAVISLCYSDLVRVYGYPYAKDNGASWGVPLTDHAIGFEEFPERSTVAQCYDFITSHLTQAISLLPAGRDNGHFNAEAARALLARVYLYCGRNQEAFDTADALIRDIEAGTTWSLATRADYLAQFDLNRKFGTEALFQIGNTASNNSGRDCLAFQLHWWGYAAALLSDSFVELMAEDPADVRNGILSLEGDAALLMKYPGSAYDVPSVENNYTVIRLSEVYLIAAEAGLKAGGAARAKALDYLNRISMRANPANEVADADFDLDRVLLERRKELVGEGHRYFDLLRNGRTIYREVEPYEVNWDFYKCVLPIDRTQFTFNPDMPQNPGYVKD